MFNVEPTDDTGKFQIAAAKLTVTALKNLIKPAGPIHVYKSGAEVHIDCQPTIGDLVLVRSPLGRVWLTLIDIRPEGDLIGVVHEFEAEAKYPEIEVHSLVKLPGMRYITAVKYC